MSFLSGPLTEAFGWALVHSLWQGALLAGAVGVVLRALRHRSAALRCAVALGGLLGQVLAFAATVLWCFPVEQAPGIATTAYASQPAVFVAAGSGFGFTAFLHAHLPTLVLSWVVGAGLLGLRLLGGWALVQRWSHRGARPAPVAWQAYLDRLGERAGIGRAVRLLESARVAVPMTVGWLKPVVLLPVGVLTGLSPAQIEAILAHELAHIRRHDYLINLLQSVVETVLFYHPATWWLAARARQEREHACDDVAVALTNNPVALAQALTALETFRREPTPHLALAFGGRKTGLLDRVKRVLGVDRQPASRANGWVVGLTLLLVAGLAVGQATQTGNPAKRNGKKAAETRGRSSRNVPPPPPAPNAPPPETPGVSPPPPPSAYRRLPADSIQAKRAFRQLDSLTKEMNAYLDARRPEMERLQRQIAAQQGKASQEQLARLTKPMQELALQQGRLSQELARLETQQQLSRKNQALLDRKQKELDALQRKMDALSERIDAEAERLEPVWERHEALADSLAHLYEPINALSERIGEAAARISELVTGDVEGFEGFEPFAPMAPARAMSPTRPVKAPKPNRPGVRAVPPVPALAPASPAPSAKPVLAPSPAAPAAARPVVDPKAGIVGPASAPAAKPTPRPTKTPR